MPEFCVRLTSLWGIGIHPLTSHRDDPGISTTSANANANANANEAADTPPDPPPALQLILEFSIVTPN